jgi:hypothetical protein
MPASKAELLALLKDPQVANALRSLALQNASVMTVGRFPGQGSAENDNWIYRDACDATHPFNIDYVIPHNFQRIIAAKLTLILRAYRTYSTLTLTSTGGQSANHSHNHNHGAHHHEMWSAIGGSPGSIAESLTANSGNTYGVTVAGAFALVENTFDTTPATDSTVAGNDHTHTVSGTTTLGIAEDVAPTNPGITIAFDGVDRTAALGGPFNANVIELDVTQFLNLAVAVQHTVALQPNQRATITGILRISYAVDSRLAQ